MRIEANMLQNTKQVKFEGQEPWLVRIGQELIPDDPKNAKIQGELSLSKDTAGFIHVQGHVSASANPCCSRCGKEVSIPLDCNVKAIFRPPYAEHAPREMALSEEDLDVYFIEDGHLDLEILVNDALQCAIPSHVLCNSDDVDGCGAESDSDDLVYADQVNSSEESPFAVLKNLKKS